MHFLPKLLLPIFLLCFSVVSAGNSFCKLLLTGEGAQVVPVGTDRQQVDRSVRDRNIYISNTHNLDVRPINGTHFQTPPVHGSAFVPYVNAGTQSIRPVVSTDEETDHIYWSVAFLPDATPLEKICIANFFLSKENFDKANQLYCIATMDDRIQLQDIKEVAVKCLTRTDIALIKDTAKRMLLKLASHPGVSLEDINWAVNELEILDPIASLEAHIKLISRTPDTASKNVARERFKKLFNATTKK